MKKTMTAFLTFLSMAALSSNTAFARQTKVSICHFSEDDNTWHLISIAEPAVDAHLRNHNDALVGGITSKTATQLDANCQPVIP